MCYFEQFYTRSVQLIHTKFWRLFEKKKQPHEHKHCWEEIEINHSIIFWTKMNSLFVDPSSKFSKTKRQNKNYKTI